MKQPGMKNNSTKALKTIINMTLLTAKEVRNQLDYNVETGEFHWKYNGRGKGRRAGAKAGSVKVKNGRHYRQLTVNGHTHTSSTIAWLHEYGEMPKGTFDYIDGNPLNDAICNLRDVTRAAAQKNSRLDKRNKSGLSGVRFNKAAGGYYRVFISDNGKEIYLGKHSDFFEACCLRKRAEKEYDYHENHGRTQS